jgi:hypothetical protein
MHLKLRLTKSEIGQLLLVCSLPFHFWAILLILKNAGNFLVKRDLVFFLGFSGYTLGFAIIESLIFFAFMFALTYLFPRSWEGKTSFAVATTLSLVLASWGIANQLFFLLTDLSPAWFEWLRLRVHYRQNLLYPLLWIVLILSAAIPTIALPRWKPGRQIVLSLAEKLSMLAPLYLLLDMVGIGAVIFRNLY